MLVKALSTAFRSAMTDERSSVNPLLMSDPRAKPPTHTKTAPGINMASLPSAVDMAPKMRSGKPGSIKNIPTKVAKPMLVAKPVLLRLGFSAVSTTKSFLA